MVDLSLTDLIDVAVVQRLQDAFSEYTGMAALTTDLHGVPVTRGSGFSRFCDLTRASELGCSRCEKCDRNGAILTMDSGKPSSYYCHTGLIDFAAPILVEGKFVGSFIGGQVRTEPVNEEEFRRMAEELGINPEEYVEEAKLTRQIEKLQVDKATIFLSEIARILSETAYRNYLLIEKSRKMEQAAKLQTARMLELIEQMRGKMDYWMGRARQVMEKSDNEELRDLMERFKTGGSEMLGSVQETLDFIKASDDKQELHESVYHVRKMVGNMIEALAKAEEMKDLRLVLEIDPAVPECLLGDEGSLWQVLYRLILNTRHYEGGDTVHLKIKSNRISYSTWLLISIGRDGAKLDPQAISQLREYFADPDNQKPLDERFRQIGLSTVSLIVNRMGGKITLETQQDGHVELIVRVPQIEVEGEE